MKKIIFILIFAIVSLSTQAEQIKSCISGRNAVFIDNQNKISAKSYVQTGLIALWDGIENIGYGQHDSSSSIWKDLIGSRVATLTEHGSFSEDAFVCDGAGYAAVDGKALFRENIGQVEIVFLSERDGIVTTIAGRPISQRQSGEIVIKVVGTKIFCMGCESSGVGVKNRSTLPSEIASCSFSYSQNDFIRSIINGSYQTISYSFFACAFEYINFGGRSQWTDSPWKGKIYCIRVYDRNLTEEEISYNYEIDKVRFEL